jgi:hypothetical protein
MQFGDKEWFAALESMTKFPSVFAFYVGSDRTVNSKLLETKATNLGNIQYRSVEPPWYMDCNMALVSVKRCKTPQDYYEECKRIRDAWDINPNQSSGYIVSEV